jgi:hypothetical protein
MRRRRRNQEKGGAEEEGENRLLHLVEKPNNTP